MVVLFIYIGNLVQKEVGGFVSSRHECCLVLHYFRILGEPFNGLIIVEGMVKVNIGLMFNDDSPLFMIVEENMPLQLMFLNVKCKVIV